MPSSPARIVKKYFGILPSAQSHYVCCATYCKTARKAQKKLRCPHRRPHDLSEHIQEIVFGPPTCAAARDETRLASIGLLSPALSRLSHQFLKSRWINSFAAMDRGRSPISCLAAVVLASILVAPAFAFDIRPDPDSTEGSVRIDGHSRELACDRSKSRRGPMTAERRNEVLIRYGLSPGPHPDYEIDTSSRSASAGRTTSQTYGRSRDRRSN
jgi:hypothetical protein